LFEGSSLVTEATAPGCGFVS